MKSLQLVALTVHWIEPYLSQFSPTVQKILKVKKKESERQYLLERLEQPVLFFFVLLMADQLIGAIEIREPTHRSQLYCWLNEQWWGYGYFQSAIQNAAQCYFSHTHELSISACVDCTNQRSYHALKKAGFIEKERRYQQYELRLMRSYVL